MTPSNREKKDKFTKWQEPTALFLLSGNPRTKLGKKSYLADTLVTENTKTIHLTTC